MCHAQLPKIHFHAVVSLLLDGAIRIHKSVLCLSFFLIQLWLQTACSMCSRVKSKKEIRKLVKNSFHTLHNRPYINRGHFANAKSVKFFTSTLTANSLQYMHILAVQRGNDIR